MQKQYEIHFEKQQFEKSLQSIASITVYLPEKNAAQEEADRIRLGTLLERLMRSSGEDAFTF